MSRSTLNEHLKMLEVDRLLIRQRRFDTKTKRQRSTRYIFAFEQEFHDLIATPGSSALLQEQEPPDPSCSHSQTGPAREPCPEPNRPVSDTPDPGRVHVSVEAESERSDTNQEEEPGREEAGNEHEEKERASAKTIEPLSDLFWDDLLRRLGVDGRVEHLPWWREKGAREHVMRWRDVLGVPEHRILEIAEDSRERHPEPPDGPKALDRVMQREARRMADDRRNDRRTKPRKTASSAPLPDLDAFHAEWINGDRYVPQTVFSAHRVRQLIDMGLVTYQRAKERGLI